MGEDVSKKYEYEYENERFIFCVFISFFYLNTDDFSLKRNRI